MTDVERKPRSDAFGWVASPWHTVLVLTVVGAWVLRGTLRVEQMRAAVNPNRVAMYERTIVFEWLVLGLVLAGVWLNGSSLLTVLGNHWSSAKQFFRDAGIGLLFLIASIVVTSIVVPHGRDGDKVIQFLLPHGSLEMALWSILSVSAGICEEAIYRGYLQKQFIALTKSVPVGIVLSALAFGAAHSYQGFVRASVIGVMGMMAGVLAYWCRSVRPGMIAHTLQDLLGAFVRH